MTLSYVIFMRLTHLDVWFRLISIWNLINLRVSKIWPFIFHISVRLLQIFIIIFKIESVTLKIDTIAEMYLKDIEKIQRWGHESINLQGAPRTVFDVDFESAAENAQSLQPEGTAEENEK